MKILSALFILICSNSYADDFADMKAKVTKQIEGSGATVSEVIIPKFSQSDIDKIKQAQKELRG